MRRGAVRRVSVVGLGKLGLSLAAVLADSGCQVSGIELDESKVRAVNEGRSPIFEPGLDELIRRNRARLEAFSTFSGHVARTEVTFVVVPTPSEESGAFSTALVAKAMLSVGRELVKKEGYHLVVLTSTVGPGSMDGVVKPTLEEAAKKRVGKTLGLCYNPEFIALGDVIRGLKEPDFILIGESDKKAGDRLSSIQKVICTNAPPVERMEFVNAELAKISVNSFVTMKMSFANTIAEIAEKIPGGNVDKITNAIGRDRRIGHAYLKGATGFGGQCFPRDNVAFSYYASDAGAQALIAAATHKVNQEQPGRLVTLLKKRGLKKGMKVGVLGLSFKPDTNIVEQSHSLFLAKRLSEGGFDVAVYDPAAMEGARSSLGTSVKYAATAEDLVRESQFVILATPWNQFASLEPGLFRGKALFDCWRFFGDKVRSTSRYSALGIA